MPSTLVSPAHRNFPAVLREESASWAVGLAFTFALFFTAARLQHTGETDPRASEIMDLPMVALPPEAPPPPPRTAEPPPAQEALPNLTGIELEHTGSPVKIAVLPPDLATLVPDRHVPLPATVSIGRVTAKPQIGIEKVDIRHVYQANEVDQPPTAVVRVAPEVWPAVYNWGPTLSVILLLRIGTDGQVENARVIESCGHPQFDAVVAETMHDRWLFTPAVKHGKKVRCLVQQKFNLVIENGSAFSVH